MYTLFMILFVLTALLLIGVVLIQQPKSAGGGLFAGTGQSLLGTSGKTFWTKFTTILAALFMLLCLGLSVWPRLQGPSSSVADSIEKQQQAAQAAAGQAPAPKPAAPTKP
ncbi:MAG TPA: preprotein translocase subunit SecG [bacterium]|nr:preprotein translocase subunit SecG [bacterium]